MMFAAIGNSEAQTATNTPPPWDVSVALGLTGTEGNSDTVLFTLTGRAAKKWGQHELQLGADAAYGEQNDEKNNESLRGFIQYNRLFTDRWYAYGRVEGLHDAIADIEYRFTVSPGVGYYFIKNEQTRFNVEAGPGIVFEKQGSDNHNYYTLRIAESFEHKFNDRVRVWQMAEFLPQVDNFENYIVNAEVGVESALSKAWALRVVLQDTYDNEPAPGRKKNDIKLIAALAWKLIQ
jgi:putative salt-induced outer membrane protein